MTYVLLDTITAVPGANGPHSPAWVVILIMVVVVLLMLAIKVLRGRR